MCAKDLKSSVGMHKGHLNIKENVAGKSDLGLCTADRTRKVGTAPTSTARSDIDSDVIPTHNRLVCFPTLICTRKLVTPDLRT